MKCFPDLENSIKKVGNMWYCYTIRKEDNFKHLSIVTKELHEIFSFITELTKIDPDSYIFEILKKTS